MTDTATTTPAPTADQIAAAHALLASAAAATPLPQAMADLCASAGFKAGLAVMSEALALYPAEPSNDLSYAVMSMKRLVARYPA